MLKWDASTGEVIGYKVYYGTKTGEYTESKDVGNVTQYPLADLNLTQGLTYYFMLRAYNDFGESEDSNIISYSAPVPGDLTPPLSPQNVTASADGGYITVNWQANDDPDIKEYRLYSGESSRAYGLPVSLGNVTQYQYLLDGSESALYFALTAVDSADNESGYSNEVKVDSQEGTAASLVISNLKSLSAFTASYEVVQDLSVGSLCYTDRSYTYPSVPDFIKGAVYIKTRNGDMGVSGVDGFITFDVNMDAMVYVAYDDRSAVKPAWMDGFTDTGSDLKTWSAMSLFGKKFSAGKVILGSNDSTGSMYTVVVTPVVTSETSPVVDSSPDTQSPVVSITAPTSSGESFNVSEPSVDVSGTADDNEGVVSVTWSNSAGGSGTASGTTSWSATGINLVEGTNVITVKAQDAAGNESTDTVTVTYTMPAPVPAQWTVLTQDDFESGWGSYVDGGGDCTRYSGSYAHQGTYAAQIRDNSGTSSSFYSAQGVNLDGAGYTELKIEFWFYPRSMESGEDFFVEYYDGTQWHAVANYVAGSDFSNNSFYHEEGIVLTEGAPHAFPPDMMLRFRCDASGNYDFIYIDEVIVSAR